MNYRFLRRAFWATVISLSSGQFADAAIIGNWIGANNAAWSVAANWSSSPGIPGVASTGGGAGDTASFISGSNRTMSTGVAVTIGTVEANTSAANFWIIRPGTTGFTFDQDGTGLAGVARLRNANTASTNAVVLDANSSATAIVTLADDFLVENLAANNTNINGAVQLAVKVASSASVKVTFSSDGPIATTPTSSPGAIWISNVGAGVNTFTSPEVLVKKGLVVINTSTSPFGNTNNPLTLGENGSGSAGIIARDNLSPINYAITVAATTGLETRTLGSAADAAFTVSNKNVLLNGDLILRAGTTSTTALQTYSGDFSGAGGLTKIGTAIAVLTGTNSYLGATNVNVGKLFVNGTSSGGGAYTVFSGATLGGSGSIGTSAVTVNAGGFLSPGTSIESLDVGSVSGAGTLVTEYDGDAGTPIDLLNVAGNLDVSSLVLDFNNIDGALTPLPVDGGGFGTGAYVLAKYGSLTGTFASVVDLPAGYYVNYAYNDGISSNNIAVVPEPSTLCAVGAGVVALAMVRKRRNRLK